MYGLWGTVYERRRAAYSNATIDAIMQQVLDPYATIDAIRQWVLDSYFFLSCQEPILQMFELRDKDKVFEVGLVENRKRSLTKKKNKLGER